LHGKWLIFFLLPHAARTCAESVRSTLYQSCGCVAPRTRWGSGSACTVETCRAHRILSFPDYTKQFGFTDAFGTSILAVGSLDNRNLALIIGFLS
jgi:hypothetical protein